MLNSASPALPWKRELCSTCPVPGIFADNACENMALQPILERPFPFVTRRVGILTRCTRTGRSNFDPHVGCGECHPLPILFKDETK